VVQPEIEEVGEEDWFICERAVEDKDHSFNSLFNPMVADRMKNNVQ
jgi:hypothetical protein